MPKFRSVLKICGPVPAGGMSPLRFGLVRTIKNESFCHEGFEFVARDELIVQVSNPAVFPADKDVVLIEYDDPREDAGWSDDSLVRLAQEFGQTARQHFSPKAFIQVRVTARGFPEPFYWACETPDPLKRGPRLPSDKTDQDHT